MLVSSIRILKPPAYTPPAFLPLVYTPLVLLTLFWCPLPHLTLMLSNSYLFCLKKITSVGELRDTKGVQIGGLGFKSQKLTFLPHPNKLTTNIYL